MLFKKYLHVLLLMIASVVGVRAQCVQNSLQIIPQTYAAFNWESTNCAMWSALTTTGGKIADMGNPFSNTNNSEIAAIIQNNDYRKIDGWKLLTVNFGVRNSIPVQTRYPYFVLYNPYKSIIRVFLWTDLITDYSSVVVKLNQVQTNGKASNILSSGGNNGISTAADKFENQTLGSDQVLTAKVNFPGNNTWTVAEFPAMFDPFLQENSSYNGKLQFTIYGVIESQVKFKATGTNIEESFLLASNESALNGSVTGDANAPSAAKNKFITDGKKLLSTVKKPNDFLTDLNKNLVKTEADLIKKGFNSDSNKSKIKKDYFELISELKTETSSESFFGKLFKTAADFAGPAGKVLDLASDVIGFFKKDTAPNPVDIQKQGAINFIPTIGRIDLEIVGSIYTSNALSTILLSIPGSRSIDNNNRPFYDCALGVAALKNTPQLRRTWYEEEVGYVRTTENTVTPIPYYGLKSTGALKMQMFSYKLTEDLVLGYNSAAGLNLVSAEVALVAEQNLVSNPNHSIYAFGNEVMYENNSEGTVNRYWMKNPVLKFLEEGIYQVFDFGITGNSPMVYGTEFVDIKNAKGLSINVPRINDPAPETHPIYLQLRARFKTLDGDDIIFNKRYRVDYYNDGWGPFLTYHSEKNGPYNVILKNGIDNDYNGNYSPSSYSHNAMNDLEVSDYTFEAYYRSNTITAGNKVTLKPNTVIKITPYYNQAFGEIVVSLFTPTVNSNQSIVGNGSIVPYAGKCDKSNPNATRQGDFESTLLVETETPSTIYPNPFKDQIHLNVNSDEVEVYDLMGKEVYRGEPGLINLSNKAAGIYIVKWQEAGVLQTEKIVLSK